MQVLSLCIYIAIIPIVLWLCKIIGMEEKFREPKEYLSSEYKE
ncbi:hypothetical protein JCM1393_09930 [Clostridium carnis]